MVGDPFGATTHADLQIRAREKGIPGEGLLHMVSEPGRRDECAKLPVRLRYLSHAITEHVT